MGGEGRQGKRREGEGRGGGKERRAGVKKETQILKKQE